MQGILIIIGIVAVMTIAIIASDNYVKKQTHDNDQNEWFWEELQKHKN